MSIDLSKLKPLPAGFGRCEQCAYRDVGTPQICYTCLRQRCGSFPEGGCDACGARSSCNEIYGNPLCCRTRWYDRNYTIAYREDTLAERMNWYKFDGRYGWGLIFARALLGFLSENWFVFADVDLIVAVPTFQKRYAAPPKDNARFILTTAARIDSQGWPFDSGNRPAIVKKCQTDSMKGKRWAQREEIAVEQLRGALSVPDIERTRGRRIIVFDDLYTSGHTLNEVARCLIRTGHATRVTGISLARQVYR